MQLFENWAINYRQSSVSAGLVADVLWKKPASDLSLRSAFGTDCGLQVSESFPRINGWSAGEKINCRVVVFRPGVNREVRLSNHHCA